MTFLRSLRRAILALSMAQALGLVSGGFSPGLAQAAELHYQYFFLPPGQTPQQVWKENAAAYPAAPRCVYAPAMDVEAIANDHRLTLLQAVEVVQQYFGLTQHQVGTDQDFEAAVKAVRRGDTRSGILETQLRQAPFIVVVDIDHTLLDQSVAHDANPDQSFRGLSGAMIHVRVAPGAFEFLQWVKGQGGMVVLMSRSASSKVTRLVGSIGLEGGLQRRPTLSLSQMVDGVMGYRYLFLTTADWLQNPTQMSAAYSPGVKKDLRLFSSVGQDKVIIVDDDPRFVRNQDRVFRIPSFIAADYDRLSAGERDRFLEQRFVRLQKLIESALADKARFFGAAFAHALAQDKRGRRATLSSVADTQFPEANRRVRPDKSPNHCHGVF